MQNLVGVFGGIIAVWLFFRGFAELGIRLSDLHPALRHRRKKYQALCRNPLYNIESPLEITALLLVAVANTDHGMKPATRLKILRCFEDAFHLNKKDASVLLIFSEWLLQDGTEPRENLKQVMQKCLRRFTREQAGSTLSMIERIADIDKTWSPAKKQLVEKIKEGLRR
jgi:hypothetical protein